MRSQQRNRLGRVHGGVQIALSAVPANTDAAFGGVIVEGRLGFPRRLSNRAQFGMIGHGASPSVGVGVEGSGSGIQWVGHHAAPSPLT